jgi:hypothetical protein
VETVRQRLFITSAVFLFLAFVAAPVAAQVTNLGTWSIGEFEDWLAIPPGPLTFDPTGGPLPPGVNFRQDPPPWAGQGANGAISGVATTPGTYPFRLINNTVPQSFTIRITALQQKEWSAPEASVGVFYSYQLTALNATGPVTFALTCNNAVNLPPPGMTLSPTGLLSGIPTSSGFFNICYSIADSVDKVFKGVSINVYDVRFVTDAALPNAAQNTPFNTAIVAAGGTGPYTFTVSNPANLVNQGLSLTPDGVLSGTPTFSGRTTYDITATDSHGIARIRRFSLSVLASPPSLPSITTYGAFGTLLEGCSFGTPCTRALFVGNGRAPYSFTVTGLPHGMDFRFGNSASMWWISPGDLELWGAPSDPTELLPGETTRTFTISVTVTDGDGQTATNRFDLTVSQLWLWQYLNNGTVGTPYNQMFRVLGGKPPYTATQVNGRLPLGLGQPIPGSLTVSGTAQETGGFTVVFDLTDTGGAIERTAHFPNFGSVASTIFMNSGDDLGTVQEGTFYSNQLQACCVPSYKWSIVSGTLPDGLTLSQSGLLSGTVAAGTSREYDFIIRVEDATNSANFAVHQFKLVVTTLAFPTAMLPIGNVGTPYNGSLTISGAVGVTWALINFRQMPPGLTLNADGTITGTPTARGSFFFQATGKDSTGHIRTVGFTISIYAAGELPPLNIPLAPNQGPFGIGPLTIQLNATGGTAPYHYSLTPGAPEILGMRVQDGQPLPTSFATSATGGLLGVLTTPGTYPTSIRVTDAANRVFDRPINVIVSPLQLLTVNTPKATVGVLYSFALTPYGGTAYAWAASNLPPGLSIDAFGVVSGTPTAAGNFFATIRLTDLPTSTTFNAGLSITVDPFAIKTGDILPQGTVGTFYSQTLSAPDCMGVCTWSPIGTLFGALTLSSTGVLSGTPTTSGGPTFFAGQVTGTNGTVSKIFSLMVLATPPQPLSASTFTFSDLAVGSSTALALFGQGGTQPYSWSVVAGSLPPGVSIQGPGETFGRNPGVYYVIGRAMQAGDYNFTLQVRDAVGAAVTLTPSTWHISTLANSYFTLPGTNQQPLVYNTPYNQPLLFFGGTGSYTFTHIDQMPPGLSLDPATGVVSGTPTNTGSFGVRIKATELPLQQPPLDTFTASITFNVAGPTNTSLNFPLAANLGTFQQGNTQSFSMTPTNGTAPYTITALSALPPGYELIPTSGAAGAMVLTGINTTPGSYNITIQAQDASGNLGVRTFTLVIAPFAVVGSTTALENGTVGVPYSHSLALFNGGSVTWAPSLTSPPPAWLTVSSTGVISGTPTAAGTFNFVAIATAASGESINFGFSIRISNITIGGAAVIPPAVVGTPYSYTFVGTGGGSTKVWTLNTGIPGLVFDSSTGTLSGTPGSAGTFTLPVTVTDGAVPETRLFLLVVTNAIPSVLDIALTSTQLVDFVVGQQTQVTLSATGGRPPYSFSVVSGSLPAGMRLLSGSDLSPASFAPGTTAIGGVPTAEGPFTVDIMVTDSVGAATRRTYSGHVKTSAIIGTIPTLVAGTNAAIQLTAVGGSAPYSFTKSGFAPFTDMFPSGVTLSDGGLISGTPTSTGTYRVLVTAKDQLGGTVTRLFVYTVVNSTSQSFVSNSGLADTPVGRHIATNLTISSFTGGPPATWNWSVVDALPPGLKLETDPDITNNGTTMLAGQPTTPGTTMFRLRAVNNANAADVVEHVFTLNVTPVQTVFPSSAWPAAPSLNVVGGEASYFALPTGHVGQPYSGTIKLAGGVPPYIISRYMGWPFNGLMPPGLSLNTATGEISGTPTQIGSYFIGLAISDSAGHASISSARVIVTQPGAPSPLSVNGDTIPGTVGSPFVLPLDVFVTGGEAPYTWTPHAATAPPPGVAIVGGGNGVPMYLAGIPSAAGEFNVALDVTDANSQTVTLSTKLFFTTIGLSVSTLAPGTAGAPYPSTPLGPFGGTAPYTIDALSIFDMPAGMTLSSAGVLSGTPQNAGAFTIVVRVKDATNNELFKPYVLMIDDALGEASAVRLGPNPIQIHYDLGAPTPAPVPVGVTSTSGAQAFTLNLSGAPWAALSANSGTTPSTSTLTFNMSGLPVGTYMGLLGMMAPGSISKVDAAPVILTVTPAPPCAYSVDPTASSMPAGGGGGTFTVTTGSTCSWTSSTPDGWITITFGQTGKGTRPVNFTAQPNTGATARTGTIRVNGAVHTITQFGSACSFAINPSTLSITASAATATIGVTASNGLCVWPTTTGLGATPTTGTGNGSVGVTIPANPSPGSRQLQATIAGQTLTVNQAGAACTTSLDSASASYSSVGGSGSVNVTTLSGCGYSTVLGPSWIHVTSGDSNAASGTLLYTIDPNSTTVGRSGSLVIGGQAFSISQEALACSATLDTTGLGNPYGPSGGAGTIGITMNGSNCSWTASSGDTWANVNPAFGTGNGTIVVGIGSNSGSPTSRSTQLTIAGQTVGLSQDGISCSYTLQSATGTAPAGGGSGSVGLSAPTGCGWSSSASDPWLSITSSGSGGTGNVDFVAQANPTAVARSSTLTITPSDPMTPPLLYTVNQGPAPCSYTLALTSIVVGADGGSDNFNFTAGTVGCTPVVQSYASWLHASSPPLVGTAGSVSWTADANTSGASRVGVIQVGTQTFTVTQLGGPCAYSLNVYGATFNAAAHPGNFFLGSPSGLGCIPTVSVDLPQIVTLGPLTGPVNNIFTQMYDVGQFNDSVTPVSRRVHITFGGQIFTVKQTSW